ncbi:MAG TPA: Na+/H+ antiporter subunit E [Devosia sp.]|nr:Na+/H+ antiporter subunit E [Devosia sp.]
MNWLSLIALFTRELIVSALRVAWLAVQPRIKLRPAFVAYPLTVTTDAQITLLANMITLTPGTLSIDVSPDRKFLHIHVLDMESEEAVIGDIAAGFETKILRVLR